jgi:acetyl esterase/lipase
MNIIADAVGNVFYAHEPTMLAAGYAYFAWPHSVVEGRHHRTVLSSHCSCLTLAGASIRAKADADQLLTERGLRAAAAHYLSGTPSNRADASPLYADLRALPPTIIHAGSAEILVDDAAAFPPRLPCAGFEHAGCGKRDQ